MFESINDNKTLLTKVKQVLDEAVSSDRNFQSKAKESFRFRNNEQWDKQEKDILSEERRPALTLNVTKAHVDLVMGLNEDIKKRYVSTPVSRDDSFLCEVINNTVYWLHQNNDWDTEENNAFESALICGRGWVGIDFDIDEKKLDEIKITETSIPVHEVKKDPASHKRDLSDASYIIWDRWLGIEDFCIKYPKKKKLAVEAFNSGSWPKTSDWLLPAEDAGGQMQNDINDESDYSDPLDVSYFDSKKYQIRVFHMEYWKYAKKYFYWHLESRSWKPVQGDWKIFKTHFAKMFPGKDLEYETTIQKELWWLQFCGEDILVHAKSPINYPGFSIVPCFLFDDVSRRSPDHFGIVELMKDPQREINKRTSQTLNLFNQQVQPGVYAESQAFVNTDQAEQSLKEAGSITWLKNGALAQERFKERTVPSFPSAVLQMGEYSREMMRHITGINPDLLGMNDKRREAGIVVQLRQQQGMAILKPVFKAYSEMKKQLFERQVRIIIAHMPSKQIKKILGEGDRYQIKEGIIVDQQTKLQCNFRNIDDIAYDIDAEPENDSMTANALEMATFMEMQKSGMPVDPKVIISKTNIPVSEKIAWIDYIEQQQQMGSDQAKSEQDFENRKLEQQHEREIKKIENDFLISKLKLEQSEEKDHLKVSSDMKKLQAQLQRDMQTFQLKTGQLIMQASLGDQKAKMEMVKIMLDADIDRKRLILDTMEIMAQAKMAGDELKLKLVLDMYKEALNTDTMDKDREIDFVKKSIDAMSNIKQAEIKSDTDIQKEVIRGKLAERAAAKAAKGEDSGKTGKQTKND